MVAQSEGPGVPSTPSEHDSEELPRIYVACLASYNAGQLHGVWIEVNPDDPDALTDAVGAMLRASPQPHAEEWAIHDHEGFAGLDVGEYEAWEDVFRMACLVRDHDGDLLAAANSLASTLDELEELLSERFAGSYESAADWMEEHVGDAYAIPEAVRPYVDWERWARDVETAGDMTFVRTGSGDVVAFRNHW